MLGIGRDAAFQTKKRPTATPISTMIRTCTEAAWITCQTVHHLDMGPGVGPHPVGKLVISE